MNISDSPPRYGNIKEICEQVYVVNSINENGEITPDDSSMAIVAIKTKYLRDGRIKELEHLHFGEPEYKYIYYYNHLKQLVKVDKIDPSGIELGKSLIRYNEKGLIIESITFCDSETIDYKSTYLYDSDSVLISEIYSSQNRENLTTHYEYLPASHERILIHADMDGSITGKTIESYNDAGNMIASRDYDKNGNLTRKITDEYDKHGNIVMTIITHYTRNSIEEIIHSYEYWYDSQNNWIKNHHYINHVLMSFSEREIVYY